MIRLLYFHTRGRCGRLPADCARTARPPGIPSATGALPLHGRHSQNHAQRPQLKAHKTLRSELPGLCISASTPQVQRSRSADDATSRRTCDGALSPLLAEQRIVSLQRALDRQVARLFNLQSRQSPTALKVVRPTTRRGRSLSLCFRCTAAAAAARTDAAAPTVAAASTPATAVSAPTPASATTATSAATVGVSRFRTSVSSVSSDSRSTSTRSS